jgi:hypothetical protein
MHPDLQRLTRALRSETCPQKVLDAVGQRLAAERPAPSPFRHLLAGAAACACLIAGLWLWQRQPAAGDARTAYRDHAGRVDTARVTADAEGALGCLGLILRDAGVRSEAIILRGTVSPVRNSLETAKSKLIKRI